MATRTRAKEKTGKKHELAGKLMDGAEMIIQVLADEGVDTIFGYSGGAILPTYDAIFRYNDSCPAKDQIPLVLPANAQAPAPMEPCPIGPTMDKASGVIDWAARS